MDIILKFYKGHHYHFIESNSVRIKYVGFYGNFCVDVGDVERPKSYSYGIRYYQWLLKRCGNKKSFGSILLTMLPECAAVGQ